MLRAVVCRAGYCRINYANLGKRCTEDVKDWVLCYGNMKYRPLGVCRAETIRLVSSPSQARSFSVPLIIYLPPRRAPYMASKQKGMKTRSLAQATLRLSSERLVR